jgi:hypothetical protein
MKKVRRRARFSTQTHQENILIRFIFVLIVFWLAIRVRREIHQVKETKEQVRVSWEVQILIEDLPKSSFLHRRKRLPRDPRERPHTRKYQESLDLLNVSNKDRLIKRMLSIFGR